LATTVDFRQHAFCRTRRFAVANTRGRATFDVPYWPLDPKIVLEPLTMKYAAAVLALGFVAQASHVAAQEVLVPEVTTYAPAVPVTTYYAPAEPVVSYYAPAPVVTRYAYPAYAPVVRAYYPAPYYYVPPRVARRWYRNGYYW
jgi:hypothetical protein